MERQVNEQEVDVLQVQGISNTDTDVSFQLNNGNSTDESVQRNAQNDFNDSQHPLKISNNNSSKGNHSNGADHLAEVVLGLPSTIHGQEVSVVRKQTNCNEHKVFKGDVYQAEKMYFNISDKENNEANGNAASPKYQVLEKPHNNCGINENGKVVLPNNGSSEQRTGLKAVSHVPYKLLTWKIIKGLDAKKDAVDQLKHIVTEDYESGCGIPNGTVIDNAKCLIAELEKCHLLGPKNVLYLQKLLSDIDDTELATKVKEYAENQHDNVLHIQEPTHSAIAKTFPFEVILKGKPEDYHFKDIDEIRGFIARIGIPPHCITLQAVGNGSVILLFQIPKTWRVSATEEIDVKHKLHNLLSNNCDWLWQHNVVGFHIAGFQCNHLSLDISRDISVDVAERHMQKLKDQIKDLKWESQLPRECLGDRSDSAFLLLPSPPGTGQEPPPRPNKSAEVKKKLRFEDSVESDHGSIISIHKERGYERPKDAYRNLSKMNKDVLSIMRGMKKSLEQKEEDIRIATNKEIQLQKRLLVLLKEKEDLETKNRQYATQIRNLQMEIDHALQKQDRGIHASNDIYNSPVDLKKVNNMTTEAVCDLLRELDLSQYVDHFSKEQVDGRLLELLEEDILMEDLGMSKLHARKLKLAVNERSNPTAPR